MLELQNVLYEDKCLARLSSGDPFNQFRDVWSEWKSLSAYKALLVLILGFSLWRKAHRPESLDIRMIDNESSIDAKCDEPGGVEVGGKAKCFPRG